MGVLGRLSFFLSFLFCSLFLYEQAVSAFPRKILAVYSGSENFDPGRTRLHRFMEMSLNHLGMQVEYQRIQDIQGAQAMWLTPKTDDSFLEEDLDSSEYRAVLTWFLEKKSIKNIENYCRWINRQMDNGLKFIVFGKFGFLQEKIPKDCQLVLENLGIEYLDYKTSNPFYIKYDYKDSKVVEFERQLSSVETGKYEWFKIKDSDARVYLSASRVDVEESSSALVFTNKRGAFAYESYIKYSDKILGKVQLKINPFIFFEEALELRSLPRPDYTTLNGSRLFFSHIDGDGIFNVSDIDSKSYSGEVIYKKILRKYKHLPITVSIITGYLDIRKFSWKREKDLYKNIFELKNIEPASHGYAHPLNWRNETYAIQVPGYSFDPLMEIEQSISMIDDLLKEFGINKETRVMLWTGDCEIHDDYLEISERLGLLNMNGGDSRFDDQYDSHAFLSPIGILRGRYRQIYSAAPNENVYTNLWRGPFYGFRDLAQTIENTESPRRIKPINIYYHFYSGEKHEALKVLKDLYELAVSKNPFNIYASDYIKIARNYFDIRFEEIKSGSFKVFHAKNLKTIRFDDELRFVDLESSKGVMGYLHYQNNLYVHLDESGEHLISLIESKSQLPYLKKANFWLKDLKINRERISFSKKAYGQQEIIFSNLNPNSIYMLSGISPSAMPESKKMKKEFISDSSGDLVINFPESFDEEFRQVQIEIKG